MRPPDPDSLLPLVTCGVAPLDTLPVATLADQPGLPPAIGLLGASLLGVFLRVALGWRRLQGLA